MRYKNSATREPQTATTHAQTTHAKTTLNSDGEQHDSSGQVNTAISRIAMLSTYPPTECGLATFSQSLATAIEGQGTQVNIVRVMNGDLTPSPVNVIHNHRDSRDTLLTRAVMNNHDAVIIQHEFGIYGGRDGSEVLELIDGLDVPIIAVLHTVLTKPTPHQRHVFSQLIDRADALITMTNMGKVKLLAHYEVDPKKIRVIPHGAHPVLTHGWITAKARPRILTWGLLGPGKGIEWAIDAMSQIQGLNPMPEYIIAGETHPHVKKHSGESYREGLVQRIADHGLEHDVVLIDRYLDKSALHRLIASADMVVLPYDSVEQVTSGVLVEALVAGKPIISTDFPHAREVLSDGTGILVCQSDSDGIANGIHRIVTDTDLVHTMKSRAKKKAETFMWTTVGQQYLMLAHTFAATKNLAAPVLHSAAS